MTEADAPKCPNDGCGWYLLAGRCARCEKLGAAIDDQPDPVDAPSHSGAPSAPFDSDSTVPEPGSTASSGPARQEESPDPAPAEAPDLSPPEVNYAPQAHGGLLRIGNPGNAGGYQLSGPTKAQLRRSLREDGAGLVRRVMQRAEVNFRPVVVPIYNDKGKACGSRIQLVAVPCDVRDALRAVEVALQATEARPATDKGGSKPRKVAIVFESSPEPKERAS